MPQLPISHNGTRHTNTKQSPSIPYVMTIITTAAFFIILLVLAKIDTSCYSFVITTTKTADNVVVASSRTQQTSSSLTSTSTALLRTTQSALSSSLASSSDNNMDDVNNDVMKNGISVGFIGCGTIASSIATGLVLAHNKENDRVTKIKSMIISRRSESKSNQLKEKFDNDNSSTFSFDITENNQEIVNQADIIFLTVLPTQAKDVLNSLEFDPKRHILISLVSTTNLEQLANYSKLNLSNVSKMICLPSIARHEGIALLCCGGNDSTSYDDTTGDNKISNEVLLKSIFNSMGGCVVLDTEHDLEACMVTTCTMGPLYGTMKKQRDWLLDNTNGLTKTDATNLVLKQFQGAILDATYKFNNNNSNMEDEDNDDTEDNTDIDMLEHLINEQTPGGLNEQALKNYSILGGLHNIQQKVMDLIVNRIRGISNGEIK